MGGKNGRLNEAVAALVRCTWLGRAEQALMQPGLQVDDYSLVSFVPLDLTKEDSIAYMLQHVDGAIQYGEDADVRTSSADA
jgi:hypothetical protein